MSIFTLAAICFCLLLSYVLFRRFLKGEKRVSVVVVGDIGRSPRMQYHSLSFSKSGYSVDLIGYSGSIPHEDVLKSESIKLHHMFQPPKLLLGFPRLAAYAIKTIWQGTFLLIALLTVPKSSHILIQDPPGLPGLAACWLVAKIQKSRFIIDWHNYGYSILALATGQHHPLVKIAHRFERIFGRLSSGNICVTNAMQKDLHENWNIRACTMHDRPPAIFQETCIEKQHRLMKSLSEEYPEFKSRSTPANESSVRTFVDKDGHPHLRDKRPALLVSSTSWTGDEDFGILLAALERYEKACSDEDCCLPDLLCVITGRGPQKEYYKKIIDQKSFQHVSICTPWLTAEDYPKLLGSADLGVSLHMSSSGLDLPMKVVDMFGCCLPVCAVNFQWLPELVKHEENGLIFKDEMELASQLQVCLKYYPNDCQKLTKFRQNLRGFREVGWDASWTMNVLPMFNES
uniref:Chitobiosyldiphosphodolichol beta-mannosyltransferase n=1 Tax=Capitella teleta TaxID=283909 RepID=X1Z4C9_CAPTE